MTTDLLRCALPAEAQPALAEAIMRPFLRNASLEGLAVARQRPTLAGPRLARWFRATRRLGSRDRRLVGEAIFGVIRHQGVLDRAGARADEARLEGWCQLIAGTPPALLEADPVSDYAAALSVPRAIAGAWLAALGEEEAAALAATLAGRAPVTIRANTAKCSRERLAARLLEEDGIRTTPGRASSALHLEERANLAALASAREGWLEVQDDASQRLCDAIPLTAGAAVLDLCAGAGGKSLALAARGARVFAHDVRPAALKTLQRRARRAGARIEVRLPAQADVVLVDAPCSGTGRLRRDPALRLGLPMLDLEQRCRQQRALLEDGAARVRRGGALVYATCSLLEEENAHAAPAGFVEESTATLWPHREACDGFFWRVWRRA